MNLKKWLVLALCLLALAVLGGCEEKSPFADIPNPQATIELSNGKALRFELFVQDAPNTVANFVELANSGFYDGQRFFRIVPGVLIQAGDPENSGYGGTDHVIQGEFEENGIKNSVSHTRGTISMARQSQYDTASSQFFIMQGNYPEYDGQYAAFGRATDAESLAAIDEIASTPVDGSYRAIGAVPTIVSIRVETDGYSYTAAKLEPPEQTEAKKHIEFNTGAQSDG